MAKGSFSNFTKKHDEIWKFIKFSFAGVSSFVVQYLVDLLFHYVVFRSLQGQTIDNPVLRFLEIDSHMDAALAYFVAATVGYIIAYLMNRKVTFNAKGHLTRSIIIYVIMVVATIFITAWLKGFLINVAERSGHVNPETGQVTFLIDTLIFIFTVTVPFLWTYPLQRFIINPPQKKAQTDGAEVLEIDDSADNETVLETKE